ncbi:MAG TPA: Gfo/Idh/MocA family oxidoreductase [Rhizobiaceae bacterium]|nr:Gfo/Idh/MocA family oxidoreductase [Rhizobiaceae bacterium]
MVDVREPVRWGVAGTGGISATIVNQSRGMDGVAFKAVSSRSIGRARSFGAEHGIESAYAGLEELIADANIEAVYIALPHAVHMQAVLACLDAGKHVLCEKPMAWSAADAALIAAHPRARDLVVAEGFMLRTQPQWRFIMGTIAMGGIGKVEAVHGFSAVRLPPPPPDASRGDLPFDRSALLDFGSYSVHMARLAFDAEPHRATARIWLDGDRDVAVSMRLDFDAGHADLTVTTRLRGARRFDVLGTEGSLSVFSPIHVPPGQQARVHAVVEGGPDAGETLTFEAVPQYGLQMAAVSAAIRDGGRPPVDLDNALGNACALDAVIRSADAGGAWMDVVR